MIEGQTVHDLDTGELSHLPPGESHDRVKPTASWMSSQQTRGIANEERRGADDP